MGEFLETALLLVVFYIAVGLQTLNLLVGGIGLVVAVAPHHVVSGEDVGQTVVAVDGALLVAMACHLHVVVHVVEVFLGEDAEEMLLGGVLDAGDELAELPVGLTLIIAGVVVLNLFSKMTVH